MKKTAKKIAPPKVQKIPLKNQLLAFMKDTAKRPLTAKEIASALKLRGAAVPKLHQTLEEMEKSALLVNQKGSYSLPEQQNLAVGKLQLTPKGYGFLVPDGKAKSESDIYIPATLVGSAMHGDRVVARLMPSKESHRPYEGEIIRIVERANKRVVGTFELISGYALFHPDDKRLGHDISVSGGTYSGAASGMKVVLEITRWPKAKRGAEGRIVEVLGWKDTPGVDILSIMRKYGLTQKFPAEIETAANNIPQTVQADEYAKEGRLKRLDRRQLSTVTIDGDDSKDFDDAVYAEKREKGGWFLGVYIADVSHYVLPDSPLDKEAFARGTSVYLVDRVVPMLPFALSNGICSLNEGEDRLVMACEMEISSGGAVASYHIAPAVIRSRHRLTYSLVNKILVEKEPAAIKRYNDILPLLKTLKSLRNALKKRRLNRGAIEFSLPEVKVKLNEKNEPISLTKRLGSLSESIIEECMLAANETVARHIKEREQPFLYRVHEEPKREKMDKLNLLLAAFGLSVKSVAGKIRPKDIAQVLDQVKGTAAEKLISMVTLRSMQQARYSAECLGHFGLAASYYTHFTSPIRRYPDLIVHRLLKEQLCSPKGRISLARQEKLTSLLPDIAVHTSSRERIAAEAERDSVKLKEIEYMKNFVGEDFSGIITGVTAFGLFVELENGVEGLVRLPRIFGDYYVYVEDEYALIGQRTGKTYKLGNSVDVTLIQVDTEEKSLDLALKDDVIPKAKKKNLPPKKESIATKAKKKTGKQKKKLAKKAGKNDGKMTGGRETKASRRKNTSHSEFIEKKKKKKKRRR